MCRKIEVAGDLRCWYEAPSRVIGSHGLSVDSSGRVKRPTDSPHAEGEILSDEDRRLESNKDGRVLWLLLASGMGDVVKVVKSE